MPKELTNQQKLFVSEYLIDRNATQAAIRAGYSETTARKQSRRLLGKVGIAAAIDKGVQALIQRNEITQDDVLQELVRLAFANMLDYMKVGADGALYVDLSRLTREQAAAIQEVTVDTFIEGKGDDARAVKRIKFRRYDKRCARPRGLGM